MLKSFPKILIILFLAIFIIQLLALLFLALAPNSGQAADAIQFKPQVIQNLDYKFDANDKTTGNIANLVRAIYKYAIGIVGILAAVVLMIGGVLWIVAGGNATAIGEAKAWIGASLTGLVLALLSYAILATVNPALVNLRTTGIAQVQKVEDKTTGCCQESNDCSMVTASACKNGDWKQSSVCSNKTCMQTSQLTSEDTKDCKAQGGSTLGIASQKDTESPKRLCTNICTGQGESISNKSFYIVAGKDNYLAGFCCFCEKPSNYCSEKGTDCAMAAGGQSGYCDGAGNCLTTKGGVDTDTWCGKKDNFGNCVAPSNWMCPSGKSRVWTGRSCVSSYYCCK